MKTFFSTRGPVRGGCGHTHLSIKAARECQLRDERRCNKLGSGAYSDRRVIAVEEGEERPLTEAENDIYVEEMLS